MTTSRLKVLLFFVFSIFGMFILPDIAKRMLPIEVLPNGTMFLLANRAAYALLVAVLALFLLSGLSKSFAISAIALVAVVIPFAIATATLAIVANNTWAESAWLTAITMFAELSLFALIPIGCWFAWGRFTGDRA